MLTHSTPLPDPRLDSIPRCPHRSVAIQVTVLRSSDPVSAGLRPPLLRDEEPCQEETNGR